MRLVIRYATQPCSRCDGSGRYSWNAVDGDRCYGCSGRGVSLTKAAAKSRTMVEARRALVTAIDPTVVQPGMRVVIDLGLGVSKPRAVTVKTAGPDPLNAGYTSFSFVEIEMGFATKFPMRRVATDEEWAAIVEFARALPGVTIAEKEEVK